MAVTKRARTHDEMETDDWSRTVKSRSYKTNTGQVTIVIPVLITDKNYVVFIYNLVKQK